MGTDENIRAILSKAEGELRSLIVGTARNGDYRGVDMARSAAVAIRQILDKVGSEGISREGEKQPSVPRKKAGGVRKTPSMRRRRKGYPKFYVNSDILTKVGWSKKQKKEYTHKVPRSVFSRVTEAMTMLSSSRVGPFCAEEIIDKVNDANGEGIPSYQVYVVLAFLRDRGCVSQRGREGYELAADVRQRAWETWEISSDAEAKAEGEVNETRSRGNGSERVVSSPAECRL